MSLYLMISAANFLQSFDVGLVLGIFDSVKKK